MYRARVSECQSGEIIRMSLADYLEDDDDYDMLDFQLFDGMLRELFRLSTLNVRIIILYR